MPQEPFIGTQIGGYLIQEELGKGGMATVYKAYHTRLRRYDAIKVISPQVASNLAFRARFEREAQLIARLDHPNIVRVYDFGEERQIAYLAMQYISGGTLRSYMQVGQPLPLQLAINYTIQMAHALHHAHSKGIVHRDVKPQNMLLSDQHPNHLLLSDFGIAMHNDGYESNQNDTQPHQTSVPASMTRAGQIMGTAKYMAPEQVNKGKIDARTDVYALGVVLYQMLAGQTPFHGNTTLELMSQHVSVLPPSLGSINPSIPAILAHIVSKALEKAPDARFQTAEEMALALNTVLNSLAVRPLGTTEKAQSPGNLPPALDLLQTKETTSLSSRYLHPIDNESINLITPAPQKKVSKKPLSVWLVAILLLVVAFISWPALHIGKVLAPQTQTTSVDQTTFDETFKDNRLNWFNGNDYGHGLITSFDKGAYVLSTVSPSESSTNGTTYFPRPQSIGLLSQNFTFWADMSQVKGALTVFFGITLHITFSANGDPSGYAFIIDSNGDYQLLKYHQGKYMLVYQGKDSAIHTGLGKINTLRVVVRGNTITCFVNKKRMLLNETSPYTYTDSEFQNGYSSLLISGPKTEFMVTHVQLTEP